MLQIGVTTADLPLSLPPLTEPVPSNWVTEEGRYYCVYAMNLSLLVTLIFLIFTPVYTLFLVKCVHSLISHSNLIVKAKNEYFENLNP